MYCLDLDDGNTAARKELAKINKMIKKAKKKEQAK